MKLLPAAMISFVLSGCSSLIVPDNPVKKPVGAGKIALLVVTHDDFHHVHNGGLNTGYINKTYHYKWDSETEIFSIIESVVERNTNIDIVNLKDILPNTSRITYLKSGLIDAKDGKWVFTPESRDIRDTLDKNNVKGLIVIREEETQASSACCPEYYIKGSGIYSTSNLNVNYYFAVPSYTVTFELLEPTVAFHKYMYFRRQQITRKRTRHMKGFPIPADLNNIPESSFVMVKDKIKEYVNDLGKVFVMYLNGYVDPDAFPEDK